MFEFIQRLHLFSGPAPEGHFSAHQALTDAANDRHEAARNFATEAMLLAGIDGQPAVLVNLWALEGGPMGHEPHSKKRRAA